MEVKEQIENKMLNRQELVAEIEADKNPSFLEVKQKIAEKFNKPDENIDVLSIKGKFGKNVFMVEANIYNSVEDLKNAIEMRKTQKQKEADKKAEEEAKKRVAEEEKKVAEEAKAVKDSEKVPEEEKKSEE